MTDTELIKRLRDWNTEDFGLAMDQAADLIQSQATQIQHLQFALADTEALEMGTAERCEALAAQLKVAREELSEIRNEDAAQLRMRVNELEENAKADNEQFWALSREVMDLKQQLSAVTKERDSHAARLSV